jgi:electron transfer flavoprotein alpha/beta subunit
MARSTKTNEQRVAEIDAKIAAHKSNIATLEAKKEAILNPKARAKRVTIKTVIDQAKADGMSPEDIAKKLGIKIEA